MSGLPSDPLPDSGQATGQGDEPTAGDLIRGLGPVLRVERLETPRSREAAGTQVAKQILQSDHALAGQYAVGIFYFARRLVRRVIEVHEHNPVHRVTFQRLAAAGMPVTRVEDEVDGIDSVDGLGRDRRRVDWAIAKSEELERDPDAHPVGPVAGEFERVARRGDGPARCKSGGAGWDGEQVR